MSYTIKIGLLTVEFYLPEVHSLKEKRGIIKSLLARVSKQFNVAASEVGFQDEWQSAAIAVVTVANSSNHAHQVVSNVLEWVEEHYPDYTVVAESIEII